MTESKVSRPIGELPHEPHYEVRIASQSYSNIATVLAGFAFAAVVLVVQTNLPTSPNADLFRDWATIYFLLAFVGCVISALTFATVTGEEILTPRSHTMALLGGIGFSISANLVILGLATLIKIFLTLRICAFVQLVFPLIMSLSPLFVAFSAFDPIIGFEAKSITKKDVAQVFVPSFAPLLIIVPIRYLGVSFSIALSETLFSAILSIAFVLIVLSAGSALVVSSFADLRFRLNLLVSGVCVGIHSFVIGLFILMLQ